MFFVKEQNNMQNSELLYHALKCECLDVNVNHSFWSYNIFSWCSSAMDELVHYHLCHTTEMKTYLLPFGTE